MVDPEGFQRVGVERLHHALRQCDEDHAVRIGRAVDGEAGRTGHFPGFDRFARVLVDAVERTGKKSNGSHFHRFPVRTSRSWIGTNVWQRCCILPVKTFGTRR